VNIDDENTRKPTSKQHWRGRFFWFPKWISIEGPGQRFVWLKTVEGRYSNSRKKWVWRYPPNDYSNVITFEPLSATAKAQASKDRISA
jgi:hypothetical protein